eukprot:253456-Rhodomonas_salina.1
MVIFKGAWAPVGKRAHKRSIAQELEDPVANGYAPGLYYTVNKTTYCYEEEMLSWIQNIWKQRPAGPASPAVLQLDDYAVHKMATVKAALDEDQTERNMIPGGLTLKAQLLDSTINSICKDWMHKLKRGPSHSLRIPRGASLLLAASRSRTGSQRPGTRSQLVRFTVLAAVCVGAARVADYSIEEQEMYYLDSIIADMHGDDGSLLLVVPVLAPAEPTAEQLCSTLLNVLELDPEDDHAMEHVCELVRMGNELVLDAGAGDDAAKPELASPVHWLPGDPLAHAMRTAQCDGLGMSLTSALDSVGGCLEVIEDAETPDTMKIELLNSFLDMAMCPAAVHDCFRPWWTPGLNIQMTCNVDFTSVSQRLRALQQEWSELHVHEV